MAETMRAPLERRTVPRCWICDGDDLERVLAGRIALSKLPQFGPHAHDEHEPVWLVRCRRCGFGQPEAVPAAEDFFDKLYACEWDEVSCVREFESGYKDAIFRDVLRGLERRVRPGRRRTLLDVGCHVGRFLDLARAHGWQAEGIELNPVTARYAATRTGLPVHRKRAQDLAGEGRRFEAVVLTDVLEHVPSPLALLRELRNVLLPGGVIAVKVPHGTMQRVKERVRMVARRQRHIDVMTNLVHVNHFPPGALALALARAGFVDAHVSVAMPEFHPRSPTRSWKQAASALVRLGVYGAARVVPFGTHVPLALNLQAYARVADEGAP